MNNNNEKLSDEQIETIADSATYPVVRQMALELLAHRDLDRERAKVPMPISRERLEWLSLGPKARDAVKNPPRANNWEGHVFATSIEEERDLASFVLAHLPVTQQPLVSETPKETSVSPDEEKTLWRYRAALFKFVKTSAQADVVRRAALALIEEEGP